MKLLLAMLLLAPGPSGGADDAREIMKLVFARAARIHARAEMGPPPCVPRKIAAVTFEGAAEVRDRSERKPEAKRPAAAPIPKGIIVLRPEDVRESRSHPAWRRLADEGPGYFEFAEPLAPLDTRSVDEAEDALLAGPHPPHFVARIDPAWLQAPLAFCAGDPSQPRLRVASPAIHGDLAFVAVEFDCVLCGQGVLLVLRRTHQGWRIVAGAQEWVS